jgi:hypothetical protein
VFLVAKNLEEALRCFIASGKSGYIWIDAICINQLDNEERTQQVQSMAKIYESAISVLVWLGMGDEDMKSVFYRLRIAEDHQRALMHQLEETMTSRMALSAYDYEEGLPVLRKPTNELPGLSDRDLPSIDRIFRHPWWSRIWVIQEATVAKELMVWCSTESISWSTLSEIYSGPQLQENDAKVSGRKNLEPMRKTNMLRLGWRTSIGAQQKWTISSYSPESLAEEGYAFLTTLASAFRGARATDNRDKIYALLGLAGGAFDCARLYGLL